MHTPFAPELSEIDVAQRERKKERGRAHYLRRYLLINNKPCGGTKVGRSLENRRLLRIAKLRDNICGDSVGGVFFLIHIYIYIPK